VTRTEKLPVMVLGGGPAGVFTACGLVKLGFRVGLITRPRPFPAWEGLSERPRVSLRHFGFVKTLASIGPKVARAAHWNGVSRVQNQEYILERRRFDQALLEDAMDKGVEVIRGRVESVKRQRGRWHISYQTAQGVRSLSTDFLVEGRGREARLGRRLSGSDVVTAPATSALLKSYRVSAGLSAMTSVAAFPKGWAWFLRDGVGTAILQIFIGSERGDLPPKDGLETYFSALTGQIPEAHDWLDGAQAEDSAVSVRTAAATLTRPAGGKDFLVVGDGSLALDPLSGNGIFYAIGSGLAAAPVINTLINRPADGDLALQFYRERIELAFAGGCQSAREFYASEQRWPGQPFWQARRDWPAEVSSAGPLSGTVELCRKPVVRDGFITGEEVIVTPDHPRGVWQVDGVPLVRLLRSADSGEGMAATFGVTAGQLAAARRWLAERNITG